LARAFDIREIRTAQRIRTASAILRDASDIELRSQRGDLGVELLEISCHLAKLSSELTAFEPVLQVAADELVQPPAA
jgi:hypothetical protein